MVAPRGDVTTLRVLTENTGTLCDIEVRTPGGRVEYSGDARIDGVPGTAAPVNISFLDTAGSVCGALLPTGELVDRFDGVDVTCIDNGMPVVIMAAARSRRDGIRDARRVNADAALKQRIESIRLQAGPAMRLGRRPQKKWCRRCAWWRRPARAAHICTRTFIPHDCHSAVGVLGAVTVATAAVMPGTRREPLARVPAGRAQDIFRCSIRAANSRVMLDHESAQPGRGRERVAAAHGAPDHARRSLRSRITSAQKVTHDRTIRHRGTHIARADAARVAQLAKFGVATISRGDGARRAAGALHAADLPGRARVRHRGHHVRASRRQLDAACRRGDAAAGRRVGARHVLRKFRRHVRRAARDLVPRARRASGS